MDTSNSIQNLEINKALNKMAQETVLNCFELLLAKLPFVILIAKLFPLRVTQPDESHATEFQ